MKTSHVAATLVMLLAAGCSSVGTPSQVAPQTGAQLGTEGYQQSRCLEPCYQMFSLGCCLESILISGKENCIKGDIQCNGGIKVTGCDNKMDGTALAVVGTILCGENNWFPYKQRVCSTNCFPFKVDPCELIRCRPVNSDTCHDLCLDNYVQNGRLQSGVYYTKGKITYRGCRPLYREACVTLVGESICLGGRCDRFKPYKCGVLMCATGCKDTGITLSGCKECLEGLIYAPQGCVRVCGDENTIKGCMEASLLEISGCKNHFGG